VTLQPSQQILIKKGGIGKTSFSSSHAPHWSDLLLLRLGFGIVESCSHFQFSFPSSSQPWIAEKRKYRPVTAISIFYLLKFVEYGSNRSRNAMQQPLRYAQP